MPTHPAATAMRRGPRRRAWLAAALATYAGVADASFLSGEALDTAANVISWVVLVMVPVIGIVVFWIVHVMPEKIAHKRHHPQRDAIQTLCLLSLVFGGLLWPFAWLWAYSKPVMYRVAYGTDKHDEFFEDQVARGREGGLLRSEIRHLREELDAMEARGALPAKLARLREELDGLKASDTDAEGGGA